MGAFEEQKAALATQGVRSRDATIRVFWNDALRFYVVAQDRRLAMHDRKNDGFFKVWHSQDRDLDLNGCAQLRREFPGGVIPYHGLFQLSYKREGQYHYSPVEPRPEIILRVLDDLSPTIDSLNNDQILEKSEKRYEEQVEREWNEMMGPEVVARDLEQARRNRVIIASG